MITVTISQLGIDSHNPTVSRHKASDPFEAMQKAVQKAYGKKASLHVNHALSMGDRGIWYGQVIKPNGSCITGDVRIATEEQVPASGWTKKTAAGPYEVWHAGPNQYRVVVDGEVNRYCSQLGQADSIATDLYRKNVLEA